MANPAHNMVSITVGRLRVLRRVGSDATGKALWVCLCDPELGGCGREIVAIGSRLRGRKTTSCGCRGEEYRRSSKCPNPAAGTGTPYRRKHAPGELRRRAIERACEAAALRESGLTWREIGDRLGVTHQRACALVRWLKEIGRPEQAERFRRLAAE